MLIKRGLYMLVIISATVIMYGIILTFKITSTAIISSWSAPNYTSTEVRNDEADNVKPSIVQICERGKVNISNACLCYADSVNEAVVIGEYAVNNTEIFNRLNQLKCAMTFVEGGRLGNIMTQYATLYGLADMNKRPAFMSPAMATILQKYFKVTIPAMSATLYAQIKWTKTGITDWMQESYRHMAGQFVQVRNYVPSSFQFYDHLRQDIRREFRLKDVIQQRAQNVLRELRGNRTSVTFVGVHARRGDYVELMKKHYKGVVGDKNFFMNATNYFRGKYNDVIFVVISSDIGWCQENIANDKGDVYFVGNHDESDPINDFAILANCNHTIFSIGSYGYWGAYLAGGEVIYLTKFTAPDSGFRNGYKTVDYYLPHWMAIAADLSPVYADLQT